MTDETTAAPDPAAELEAMQSALQALSALDAGGRSRAVTWLAGALDVTLTGSAPAGVGGQTGVAPAAAGGGEPSELGTPRQFLASKSPTTDVERVTCLAYYLTYARNTPHFKTKELVELNTEAAGQKFSNPSQATANAKIRNGYLAEAGRGNRQITPLGEAVVLAMPDREAVARAIADGPRRVRRKSGPRKKATKRRK
jgi:hypothetical protein